MTTDSSINSEIDLVILASENLLKEESKLEDEIQSHKNGIEKLENDLSDLKKEITRMNDYTVKLYTKISSSLKISKAQDLSENIETIRKSINREIENSNVVSIFKRKNDVVELLDSFFNSKPTDLKQVVETALSSIEEIERTVIHHRFQVYENTQTGTKVHFLLSYEDISIRTLYSATWVRIKFLKGMRKLKHPSRSRKLRRIVIEMNKFAKDHDISKEDLRNYMDSNLLFQRLLVEKVFGCLITEID